jgi:hypothetical protein
MNHQKLREPTAMAGNKSEKDVKWPFNGNYWPFIR